MAEPLLFSWNSRVSSWCSHHLRCLGFAWWTFEGFGYGGLDSGFSDEWESFMISAVCQKPADLIPDPLDNEWASWWLLHSSSWFNSRSSGEWVSFMMTALFARSHMQFLLFIFHWWIVFALEGVYSIQKYKAFIIALVGPGEQLYIIKLQNLYIIKGWKITNMFLQQGEPQFGQ